MNSQDPSDSKDPGVGYSSKVKVREKYHIVGFISSGTYGRVYKAVGRLSKTDIPLSPLEAAENRGVYAIKKFVANKGDG